MSSFHNKANRLLQSSYPDYQNELRKFINYLDSNIMIKAYIDSCGGYNENIKDAVNIVCNYSDKNFDLGNTTEEEVQNIYSILKYISQNYNDTPMGILMAYYVSKNLTDNIKNFNNRVVRILILNIDEYLTGVGIDMGLDKNIVYNVNGKQVNIANDNAAINAVQNNNNGINTNELKGLISAMRESLNKDLPAEDIDEANKSIDIIENEIVSGNPDEEKVRTHFKLLKRIDTGVKFASACCTLINMANKIYPFLDKVSALFQ